MCTFAHTFLTAIGQLLGDIESKTFRVMSKVNHGRPVSTKYGLVSIRTNENGFRQVYLDNTPIVRCGVEKAVDVLEELESMSI